MQDWLAPPDLSRGRGAISGRMTREQAAAHARLARLPRTVHEQVRADRSESAKQRGQKASETKRLQGTHHKGPAVVLEGSRPARRKKA